MASPRVGIVMGSDSDWPKIQAAAAALDEFEIPYEVRVMSAHRTPQVVAEYAVDGHPARVAGDHRGGRRRGPPGRRRGRPHHVARHWSARAHARTGRSGLVALDRSDARGRSGGDHGGGHGRGTQRGNPGRRRYWLWPTRNCGAADRIQTTLERQDRGQRPAAARAAAQPQTEFLAGGMRAWTVPPSSPRSPGPAARRPSELDRPDPIARRAGHVRVPRRRGRVGGDQDAPGPRRPGHRHGGRLRRLPGHATSRNARQGCLFRSAWKRSSQYLAGSRPTAVNLFWALDRMNAPRPIAAAQPHGHGSPRGTAGRGPRHPRGGPRDVPRDRPSRSRSAGGRAGGADPLQRRRIGHGRLRHGPGRDLYGARGRASVCTSSPTKPGRCCKARG